MEIFKLARVNSLKPLSFWGSFWISDREYLQYAMCQFTKGQKVGRRSLVYWILVENSESILGNISLTESLEDFKCHRWLKLLSWSMLENPRSYEQFRPSRNYNCSTAYSDLDLHFDFSRRLAVCPLIYYPIKATRLTIQAPTLEPWTRPASLS